MKKRILTLALALIMIVSLLPMTALADGPTVALTFNNSVSASVEVTVAPGDTVYITTDENAQFVKWEDTEAPADKFVKIEYAEGDSAIMNVTFNNINANCGSGKNYHRYGIHFPAGEYAVVLNLVGENKIENTKSSCIKLDNSLDNTITGAGSLSLTNIGDPHGALWSNAGDLLIKDTTINFTVTPGNSSMHHAILATKGSVTLDGVKFETKTQGGYQVFFGKPKGDDKDGRYSLDPDTERKLVIKNSDIFFDSGSKTAFKTASAATISNSTLKLQTSAGEGPLFSPAPTFEGEYTAIAGLKKDAEKNPHKLKEFNPKKLGSYTYIKIVPGIVEGLIPTTAAPTTEATEAPTTEATEAPTTADKNEATTPTTSDKNEATTPTTSDKNEATKPTTADKNNNKTDNTDNTDKTDKGEENSSNPLKVVLIVMIVLAVAAAGTVGVVFYLRNKNAAAEEDEAEAEEE